MRLKSTVDAGTASVMPRGTVSTGHLALRITFSVTEPRTRCSRPERPCVPMTMRSLGIALARSTISEAGFPSAISNRSGDVRRDRCGEPPHRGQQRLPILGGGQRYRQGRRAQRVRGHRHDRVHVENSDRRLEPRGDRHGVIERASRVVREVNRTKNSSNLNHARHAARVRGVLVRVLNPPRISITPHATEYEAMTQSAATAP